MSSYGWLKYVCFCEDRVDLVQDVIIPGAIDSKANDYGIYGFFTATFG